MNSVVESVRKVGFWRTLARGVQNRFVVHPDDQRHSSPFILLVEDCIEATSEGFGMHPHRGFETVTLVLEGTEHYWDHLGTEGRAQAGDVQWTRAGRGIFHSGEPEGKQRLHVLQLWLNLPATLKAAEPSTRGQCLVDTPVSDHDGVRVIVHSGAFEGLVQPHRSLWPLTLIEAELKAGSTVRLSCDSAWRSFIYVLTGHTTVGELKLDEGSIAWLSCPDVTQDLDVRIETSGGAHIVFYASPPINEPVALNGPFVMNTEDEIRQAYDDLRNGVLI